MACGVSHTACSDRVYAAEFRGLHRIYRAMVEAAAVNRQRTDVGRTCVPRIRRVACGVAGSGCFTFSGKRSDTGHSVFKLCALSASGTPPLLGRTMTGAGTQRTVTFHDTRAMMKFGVTRSGYHERDTAGGLCDSTGSCP